MKIEKMNTWPSFSNFEAKEISKVLLSNKVNYWTGSKVRDFEQEFAKKTNTKYAVALFNGTVALDLALRAVGIEPGDEVVVTPRTYVASVSCIVNLGATPVFSDVDYISGNITAKEIRKVITKKTKAIICVHLAGWPCDMDPIMELAKEKFLKVIEDCSQAHGSKYKGRSVGSIGHIGTWSFCQDKIITTGGEGGMVTTNDKKSWEKMWSFKDHGKNILLESKKYKFNNSTFNYVHDSFGTNYRMLEIQAVIGLYQLSLLEKWINIRTRNARILSDELLSLTGIDGPIFIPTTDFLYNLNKNRHAFYKFYIYLNPSFLKSKYDRSIIIMKLNELGVQCSVGTCPEVYLEKAFDSTVFKPNKRLKVAKEIGEKSIMFQVHPSLSAATVRKTGKVINNTIEKYKK